MKQANQIKSEAKPAADSMQGGKKVQPLSRLEVLALADDLNIILKRIADAAVDGVVPGLSLRDLGSRNIEAHEGDSAIAGELVKHLTV